MISVAELHALCAEDIERVVEVGDVDETLRGEGIEGDAVALLAVDSVLGFLTAITTGSASVAEAAQASFVSGFLHGWFARKALEP